MNCCDYDCTQELNCPARVTRVKSRTPKFHTEEGGEVIDTGIAVTFEGEEPDVPVLSWKWIVVGCVGLALLIAAFWP